MIWVLGTWAVMDTPVHSLQTWTAWQQEGSGLQISTAPVPSAARPGTRHTGFPKFTFRHLADQTEVYLKGRVSTA